MRVGNNGKKQEESKGGETSGKETDSRKHASPKEEGQGEQPSPEKEPAKKEKKTIEFDREDGDTVEYDFCFVNAVIATVERFSLEGKDGQIPTDFYYIIAEARERLDKIRVILGYLHETT